MNCCRTRLHNEQSSQRESSTTGVLELSRFLLVDEILVRIENLLWRYHFIISSYAAWNDL